MFKERETDVTVRSTSRFSQYDVKLLTEPLNSEVTGQPFYHRFLHNLKRLQSEESPPTGQ